VPALVCFPDFADVDFVDVDFVDFDFVDFKFCDFAEFNRPASKLHCTAHAGCGGQLRQLQQLRMGAPSWPRFLQPGWDGVVADSPPSPVAPS
jgi:hypothetical protein